MASGTFKNTNPQRLLLFLGACIPGIQEPWAQQSMPDPGVYESNEFQLVTPPATDRIGGEPLSAPGGSSEEARPVDERQAPTPGSGERESGGSAARGADPCGKCGMGKCGAAKGDPGCYE